MAISKGLIINYFEHTQRLDTQYLFCEMPLLILLYLGALTF